MDIKDLNLEQTNWELCMVDLDDAIKHLQECQHNLRKALNNIRELKGEVMSMMSGITHSLK